MTAPSKKKQGKRTASYIGINYSKIRICTKVLTKALNSWIESLIFFWGSILTAIYERTLSSQMCPTKEHKGPVWVGPKKLLNRVPPGQSSGSLLKSKLGGTICWLKPTIVEACLNKTLHPNIIWSCDFVIFCISPFYPQSVGVFLPHFFSTSLYFWAETCCASSRCRSFKSPRANFTISVSASFRSLARWVNSAQISSSVISAVCAIFGAPSNI